MQTNIRKDGVTNAIDSLPFTEELPSPTAHSASQAVYRQRREEEIQDLRHPHSTGRLIVANPRTSRGQSDILPLQLNDDIGSLLLCRRGDD